MSHPLSTGTPDEDRERGRAEAERAVFEVLERVEQKRAAIELAEAKRAPRRMHVKELLLLALCAFNLYVWLGDPPWLRLPPPPTPNFQYYADGYRVAVALQRERIEAFRLKHGRLPLTVSQAGAPIEGVDFQPADSLAYLLLAGEGPSRVVYDSNDSLEKFLGESLGRLRLFQVEAKRP